MLLKFSKSKRFCFTLVSQKILRSPRRNVSLAENVVRKRTKKRSKMLGIFVQLILSYFLISLIEKKNLSVLGVKPTVDRASSSALTFFIACLFCAAGFLLKMYFGNQYWRVNPLLDTDTILNGIWWNIKSVLFEELIFRGVLLYILIQRLGSRKAIVISAVGFGIYHWFSFGIFGNIVPMIVVFVITGTMGLLLAYSYAKTLSLYIPIAIHLGWNVLKSRRGFAI